MVNTGGQAATITPCSTATVAFTDPRALASRRSTSPKRGSSPDRVGLAVCPAWGSGCRPGRVVTFRSPVLRDWSNVGNPGSVQDGFGVGRAVAGDALGFRRGAGPAGSVPGFPAGRPFRVFGGGLRSGFLPGARQRGQDVAALGFLPVQGVPTRAGAADPLPRARGASGGGGLGTAGVRVHVAVRGVADRVRDRDAGGSGGGDDQGTRHPHLAGAGASRGRATGEVEFRRCPAGRDG